MYPTLRASLTNVTSLVQFQLKLGIIKLLVEQAGLHLGEAREGICPPENRMAPLGSVLCIVTYIIFERVINHMSHHCYLIKIKFLR